MKLSGENEKTCCNVIVTGAAGFTGVVLTEQLLKKGYNVWALVREGSSHNERLTHFANDSLHVIEFMPCEYTSVLEKIDKRIGACIHLMWTAGSSEKEQYVNIEHAENVLRVASGCGCRLFLATGSQAEYGVVDPNQIITEDYKVNPVTVYGKAKVKTYNTLKKRANELGIELIWARIFSLIGRYEPRGRMLPELFVSLKRGDTMKLSSCKQNWDYLDVYDAADALIALLEKGMAGEIYNIANGQYRPLKDYTEQMRALVNSDSIISYGKDPNPFISLQPSIRKIINDTGWEPERSFDNSVKDYEYNGYV